MLATLVKAAKSALGGGPPFTLYMWGNNSSGELGDGTSTNAYTPQQ